ncbi:MAG: ABC transporter substrate-binding protein [Thermodesulfobacteriota bacterium]
MQYVRWVGLVVMLVGLLMAGCARLPLQTDPGLEAARLLNRARQAMEQGDASRAQALYAEAAHQEGLDQSQRIQAWKGLARAAQANADWEAAELALRQWVGMRPKLQRDWQWQSRFLQVLLARDGQAWLEHALSLIHDQSMPWPLRVQTALHVVQESIQAGRAGQGWSLVNTLYGQAPGQKAQEGLEEKLLDLLQGVDDANWEAITKQPAPKDTPADWLIRWADTVRALKGDELDWSQAETRLTNIVNTSGLAMDKALRALLAELEKQYAAPTQAVGVICPLSGSYAQMGWKIALGASVAQWQFETAGQGVDLYLVNSQAQGWRKRLEALPKECSLLGGPLRRDVWTRIVNQPLEQERTFFPFRSHLDPGQEGEDGYRFFPGTMDQVQPLVDMVHSTLAISDYAVLYPQSDYGRRLSAGFRQVVEKASGRVMGSDTYEPGQPGDFKRVVADLLGAKGQDDSQDSVSPDFQAVFLPDSFSQVQMLIPEFFYFDQDQLIFLGPTLWSQGLEDISELDRKYFQLALMTTPWLPDTSNPAVRRLAQGLDEMNEGEADFWIALGYDFVRLAQRVHKASQESPEADLQGVLQSVEDFSWSMAPISWDAKGRATQDLFVVRPGEDDPQPVRAEQLKAFWEAAGRN